MWGVVHATRRLGDMVLKAVLFAVADARHTCRCAGAGCSAVQYGVRALRCRVRAEVVAVAVLFWPLSEVVEGPSVPYLRQAVSGVLVLVG